MEDAMDRTLRWMTENLSGAQRAVHPPGHEHAGKHCSNSGTGVLACCCIDALGKVLLKGKKGIRKRFDAFVHGCMQDFLKAGSTKALPKTPERPRWRRCVAVRITADSYTGFILERRAGDAPRSRATGRSEVGSRSTSTRWFEDSGWALRNSGRRQPTTQT